MGLPGNLVWATPNAVPGIPLFRALVAADIPNLDAGKITTGLIALARGGTNADLSATGGTSQVLKQSSTGAAVTVGQLAFTDISGTAATGQIPNLAASKITSGQLALARGGTASDLSATGGTSQVLKQSSSGAVITVGQLAFTDISGNATLAQLPTGTDGTALVCLGSTVPAWSNVIRLKGPYNSFIADHDTTNNQSGVLAWINASGSFAMVAKDSPNQWEIDFNGTAIFNISGAGVGTFTGHLVSTFLKLGTFGTENDDGVQIANSSAVMGALGATRLACISGGSAAGIAGKLLSLDNMGAGYKLCMDESGNLGVVGGLYAQTGMTCVTGGITFNANPGGGTQATLNDYEVGTWTPTDQSGAGLSITVTTANYIKVGKMVFVELDITYPATANTNQAAISLPFNNAGGYGALVISTNTSAVSAGARIQSNTIVFPSVPNTGGGGFSNATLSTTHFIIAGTYQAAT